MHTTGEWETRESESERESEKWERKGRGKVRNTRGEGEGGRDVWEWGEKEIGGGELKIKN